MSTAQDGQVAQDDSKKITFKFCREWYVFTPLQTNPLHFLLTLLPSSNMLYPAEDRERGELVFTCRTCMYSEAPSSSCVYRNDLSNTVGETAGITQDVGQDPTVGLNFLELCTVCGKEITCEKCGTHIAPPCWLEVDDSKNETSVLPSGEISDLGYVSDPMSTDEDEDDDEERQFEGFQEFVQNFGILDLKKGTDVPNDHNQHSQKQSQPT
jgi:DNA-directed RNA polymerase II subunit RPB9